MEYMGFQNISVWHLNESDPHEMFSTIFLKFTSIPLKLSLHPPPPHTHTQDTYSNERVLYMLSVDLAT